MKLFIWRCFDGGHSSVWSNAAAFICFCLHNLLAVWWRVRRCDCGDWRCQIVCFFSPNIIHWMRSLKAPPTVFRAAFPSWAVWGPSQSIAEMCLWFLTLPEGSVTNGPTREAFFFFLLLYVKVTTEIILARVSSRPVRPPGVSVRACASQYYLLLCVGPRCAYLRCTMLISLRRIQQL